jgi:hypothetical protein
MRACIFLFLNSFGRLGNYAAHWHGECTLGPLGEFLAEAGVRQIYGVSGDSLNGIADGTQKLLGWFGGYGS